MCGILLSNIDHSEKTFENALKKQSFRGPDGEKYIKLKNLFLGFNYLSITGEKKKFWQPYKYKHLTIIFNGEIYNFRELNKEIKKIDNQFFSESDTKTLITHIYHYGFLKTIQKIRGMWSLCLFDSRTNKLFVSRDRLGIKPLFYYKNKKHFIFSSTIKSLQYLSKKKKININYLKKYLLKGSLDQNSQTPFNNIYNFPKAKYLEIDIHNSKKKFIFKKYWKLERREFYTFKDIKSFQKELNKTINIHSSLRNDVKATVPLSSGLDSTFIVKKIKKISYNSVSLGGHGFDQEKDNIKKFIILNNLKHSFLKITKQNLNKPDLKKFIQLLDQPVRSMHPYFQYLIRKNAKSQNIRVLFNGDGGDEVFGGYTYAIQYLNNFYLKNLKSLRLKKKYKIFKKDFKSFVKKNGKNILKSRDLKSFLIRRLFVTHIPYWLRVDDEISMINSIENRVPYLDHILIEFCFSFKSEFFYQKGKNKFFFREAIKKFLPKFILKQKKIGKPGGSENVSYSLLYKDIKNIIQNLDLKKFLNVGKQKLLLQYDKDVNNNNNQRVDFWFRIYFLHNWLKLKKLN